VKAYLSQEYLNHPERGCPLPALEPELARVELKMKKQILPLLVSYKDGMLPFMPGHQPVEKERAFFIIFSTMFGATEIARMLPEVAMRGKPLSAARNFLLSSF
jgi:TetR/AcrR family transcriptional repressor of nem operon